MCFSVLFKVSVLLYDLVVSLSFIPFLHWYSQLHLYNVEGGLLTMVGPYNYCWVTQEKRNILILYPVLD